MFQSCGQKRDDHTHAPAMTCSTHSGRQLITHRGSGLGALGGRRAPATECVRDRGAGSTGGHLVSAACMQCVPMCANAEGRSCLHSMMHSGRHCLDRTVPTIALSLFYRDDGKTLHGPACFSNANHCKLSPCRDKGVLLLSGIRAPRAMLARQPRQGRRASRHALVSRSADHRDHCLA